MPSSCEYGMCPRPATYSSYCSEYHSLAAQRKELKEKLAEIEQRIKALQQDSSQRGVQRSVEVANQ